jgi:hypothetical protein
VLKIAPKEVEEAWEILAKKEHRNLLRNGGEMEE